MIILTPEQESVINTALSSSQQVFRIGGYAGTGKTTIAQEILRRKPGGVPCAFMGKAVEQLRKKGVKKAQTIHSTIYRFDRKSMRFFKKPKKDILGTYFYIDEASTVNQRLWEDLLSYNMKVILTGDHGQLEPVGKNPNLMLDLDVELSTIHRQAADNPIIQESMYVRASGKYSDRFVADTDPVSWYRSTPGDKIILCGFNKTRHSLNRELHDNPSNPLIPGRPIIILKNDPPFYNGMVKVIRKVNKWHDDMVANVTFEDDTISDVGLDSIGRSMNQRDLYDAFPKGLLAIDHAYAITTHKSQGSEWEHVHIVDEQCDLWSPVRWRYTAVTRASETFTVTL